MASTRVSVTFSRNPSFMVSSHVHKPHLSPLESEMFGSVMEDAVDQLAILGAIVPDYTGKPSAAETIMGDELTQILADQKQLESKFNDVSFVALCVMKIFQCEFMCMLVEYGKIRGYWSHSWLS